MSREIPAGVEWWYDGPRREYVASDGQREPLRVTAEDLLADAQRAHPIRWPTMTCAQIDAAIAEAWSQRMAEWVTVVPWEPPEWIPAGTDLSFLLAWSCVPCGQRNSGWSRECGRCRRTRPMDPLAPRRPA